MKTIAIRIDGLKLKIINQDRGGSMGAAMARAAKVRLTRDEVRLEVENALGDEEREPSAIHVTRVAPGTLDDDNLVGAWKAALDGCALALGVDDKRFEIVTRRERGIPVTFEQRKEGVGRYAAIVELRFA